MSGAPTASLSRSSRDRLDLSTPEAGHKDGLLATDISVGALAMTEHIHYSAVLATVNPNKEPEIYIVRGKAAKQQLMILRSQPGEASYSPLWVETFVRWVQGVKPIVIKSDTQINLQRRSSSYACAIGS